MLAIEIGWECTGPSRIRQPSRVDSVVDGNQTVMPAFGQTAFGQN